MRDLGQVDPSLSKTLTDFADSYPDLPVEWVDLAFEDAISYNKVSWHYVAAILETWQKQGYSSKERKVIRRGKSGQDSSNDAKGKRPGAGFEPLSGEHARVS